MSRKTSYCYQVFPQNESVSTFQNYGDPRTVGEWWKDEIKKLPVSKHSLLSLLDTVERWKNEVSCDAVVVQCM